MGARRALESYTTDLDSAFCASHRSSTPCSMVSALLELVHGLVGAAKAKAAANMFSYLLTMPIQLGIDRLIVAAAGHAVTSAVCPAWVFFSGSCSGNSRRKRQPWAVGGDWDVAEATPSKRMSALRGTHIRHRPCIQSSLAICTLTVITSDRICVNVDAPDSMRGAWPRSKPPSRRASRLYLVSASNHYLLYVLGFDAPLFSTIPLASSERL